MNNTIRIAYRENFSLHQITSLIESVKGVKIKHLQLVTKGKHFIGVLDLELSQSTDLNLVIALIRSSRQVSAVERINSQTAVSSPDCSVLYQCSRV
jgi:uncharacterized protein with ACT and thioredoxin-like domain